MPIVPGESRHLVPRLLAAVTTALVPLGIAGCTTRAEVHREPPAPTVTVSEVLKKDVPVVATSNGTTRSLKQVTVRARVKGFLKEQLFREGSNVKAGQLLFVIDEEEFQVNLALARANLAEADANL